MNRWDRFKLWLVPHLVALTWVAVIAVLILIGYGLYTWLF
jgi:hypothetical protein